MPAVCRAGQSGGPHVSGGGRRSRCRRAGPAGVREGRDELIAPSWDGRDEARLPVIVLQLDAQAPDVPIDDVALGDEVRAPDRVEDLVAGHDPAAAAGEQIQEALLDTAEVDQRVPGPNLAAQDVEL